MFNTKPWLLIAACALSSVLAKAADDASGSVPAPHQTQGAKFRVELPDGATIELVRPVQIYLDGQRYFPKTTSANNRLGSFKLVSTVEVTKALTAVDADVVKRIFANWQARQDHTKSFHVEWNTRVSWKSRLPSSNENLRRALWVMGDDRFRIEHSIVGSNKIGWDHWVKEQRTWNGAANVSLEWLRASSDAPQGAIRQSKPGRSLNDLECRAPVLTFRIFHPLIGLGNDQFQVVTQNAIVDGVHCVKLRGRSTQGTIESCWVDPTRDDLIVLWESTIHGGALSSRIAIQYRQSPEFGWLPHRWTCQYQSLPLTLECTVTKCTVNEGLPEKTFQIDFPPGTLVFDETSRKEYLVAADGSRTAAYPFDSVRSPKFRHALDALDNTLVEPGPLNLAIDFMSQHLSIPIEIDERAFRDAAISPKIEVQCDIGGMTVREQLRWLTAQCPKPIRLEERNDKLVLTPAPHSKEASHGNPRRSAVGHIP